MRFYKFKNKKIRIICQIINHSIYINTLYNKEGGMKNAKENI